LLRHLRTRRGRTRDDPRLGVLHRRRPHRRPTSWTAPLDARRLRPGDHVQQSTAGQLRSVVTRLVALGRWKEGDTPIRIVADCGYDGPYLAHQLAGLPVEVCVRMRGDRVLYRDPPANGGVGPQGGRPRRHGARFEFHTPATWGDPLHEREHHLDKYGHTRVRCFARLHVQLSRQTVWGHHPEPELPLIPGTVLRLDAERLPSGGTPKPLWLWWSRNEPDATLADTIWSCFLRRFDLEHTFRYWKQQLGWTRPRLREPAAADRWTALVMAVYTQLRLARPLAEDLKRPWERPLPVERLTPQPSTPRVSPSPQVTAHPHETGETLPARPGTPTRQPQQAQAPRLRRRQRPARRHQANRRANRRTPNPLTTTGFISSSVQARRVGRTIFDRCAVRSRCRAVRGRLRWTVMVGPKE
ncbi:transposase, partial [Streptomyces sp. NPDC101455]|uniref:transposase n=1 Tax=Streptomyces sp. NPDC101455 TaxID=3366142 RepID=UPI00381AD501